MWGQSATGHQGAKKNHRYDVAAWATDGTNRGCEARRSSDAQEPITVRGGRGREAFCKGFEVASNWTVFENFVAFASIKWLSSRLIMLGEF